MTKLSFFLVSMRRIVAVGMAAGAGAAIIPASAAPDDDAPSSEASIPRGTTISYDGDAGVVLIGMPGRTLVNLGSVGSNSFGFGDDGIQRGLPTIPLEPFGSGYGSPADFLASPVGIDWLQ
jgi:hypothetical protein